MAFDSRKQLMKILFLISIHLNHFQLIKYSPAPQFPEISSAKHSITLNMNFCKDSLVICPP